jgi:hypothetical protein
MVQTWFVSPASIAGAWHPSTLVTVELTGERDMGDLRQGRFVQAVSGTRVRFNVSPDMQVYWQYDTLSNSVGTNSKLRWTFRALGDLFVMYSNNVRQLADRWQLDSNQLLVKLQYAFRYWPRRSGWNFGCFMVSTVIR